MAFLISIPLPIAVLPLRSQLALPGKPNYPMKSGIVLIEESQMTR